VNNTVYLVAQAATGNEVGGGYTTLIVSIVVVGAIFGFLWQRGYLVRIRDYVAETQEELKKCTWPSVDELKGSTLVVMFTILLLGIFTISVDWVLSMVIRLIT
jgi:preprotein translocase subunit SecE